MDNECVVLLRIDNAARLRHGSPTSFYRWRIFNLDNTVIKFV